MNLLLWVLQLVDGIFSIFRQLAGLENVGETDLISLFLNNDGITKIFFGILIVGVVVAAIAIVVAIIKAFVNLSGGERKSISKITGQGIGTIFISLLMAGIMVSGITIANSLLRDVDSAFGGGEQSNICNDLFEIGVDDREYIMVGVPEYQKDENGQYITDESGEKIPVWITDSNGNLVLDSNGDPTPKIDHYDRVPVEGSADGWTDEGRKRKGETGWSILNENADTILGKYPKDWIGIFEQPDKKALNKPLIYYGSFNFLLGYFAAIIVLVAVASACLGLIKRLYDIVVLFLSLPLIVSTIPLDDGARFKVWRETVISKVVIAYGAVFAVNVFLTMVPIITANPDMGKIMQMLLICGGGLSISGGILLFARLFGTDAAESRDLAQSARTLLAGGVAGMHGIKTVGHIANNTVGGKGVGGAIVKSLFGNKTPLATASAGTSALSAGSSLTPASMPGSSLGEALRTAGVQSGTWAKDPTTGRFVSSKRAQELLSGATKKLNK